MSKRAAAAQISREFGGKPKKYRPMASKMENCDCACCDTACMSRNRRSNGLLSKIAVAPEAKYTVSTTCLAV